ncbi:MAG TPA: FHA domain-containing protein [Pirellulales bacterium]|jgi:pSer/pThr/pTyr-binding forkhead associated (FHA) protein|nr:FHA domain-containing protein [Pirellulales bacterium]
MELTLKLLTGRNAGQEIPIPISKFLIGRADDCHLRPHSETVSRHHCVLLVEEGFCAVRDFGSRNGTLVNEQKVVGQHELHNGDRLKVGSLEFEVQLSSRVGGKKRPKVKDVKDAAQRTAAPVVAKGDRDISDWLAEDGGENHAAVDNLRETRQPPHETPENLSTRETAFLKTPADETTTVKPLDAKRNEPVSPAPKPADSGGMEALKRTGKFAAPTQAAPKDSREAANMALRKLFNNRNG